MSQILSLLSYRTRVAVVPVVSNLIPLHFERQRMHLVYRGEQRCPSCNKAVVDRVVGVPGRLLHVLNHVFYAPQAFCQRLGQSASLFVREVSRVHVAGLTENSRRDASAKSICALMEDRGCAGEKTLSSFIIADSGTFPMQTMVRRDSHRFKSHLFPAFSFRACFTRSRLGFAESTVSEIVDVDG